MNRRVVKTIIILPGTALVLVPAIILAIADNSNFSYQLLTPHQVLFWLALLPAGAGLGLAVWTVKLFVNFGDGTPAPWDPPKKLVIRGPYRHVRNPMITGAVLMLLAEAMLFQSWPISLWMVIFFMGNSIYFPLIEEKGLEKRFGDSYRKYKAHVPRWIPRLRPWNQQNDKA
ncbi:MAG: isoprenylcysteine carboxylmethyltransferase family protein [Desulfobacterales bacterium]|jgi:protein-S-isoprenylcysteine O-methyltransferase Ste14